MAVLERIMFKIQRRDKLTLVYGQKVVEVGLTINIAASSIILIISCRYPTNKFHLIIRGFAPANKTWVHSKGSVRAVQKQKLQRKERAKKRTAEVYFFKN